SIRGMQKYIQDYHMTPEQLRMARNALRLGTRELAETAGVSFTTISRFETEKGGLQHSSAEAIRKALEAKGIQFLDNGEVAGGPGVAIKRAE
ncbi:MAG: helix-turn-helix transcriptional regulator, partial [Cyanobacteria bacterium P01_A01_bin.17]